MLALRSGACRSVVLPSVGDSGLWKSVKGDEAWGSPSDDVSLCTFGPCESVKDEAMHVSLELCPYIVSLRKSTAFQRTTLGAEMPVKMRFETQYEMSCDTHTHTHTQDSVHNKSVLQTGTTWVCGTAVCRGCGCTDRGSGERARQPASTENTKGNNEHD